MQLRLPRPDAHPARQEGPATPRIKRHSPPPLRAYIQPRASRLCRSGPKLAPPSFLTSLLPGRHLPTPRPATLPRLSARPGFPRLTPPKPVPHPISRSLIPQRTEPPPQAFRLRRCAAASSVSSLPAPRRGLNLCDRNPSEPTAPELAAAFPFSFLYVAMGSPWNILILGTRTSLGPIWKKT